MTDNLPALQMPSYLAGLKNDSRLAAINDAASSGVSSGGWPRISIRASRFRLQTPQGGEEVVPTLHLDVIIVNANPHGLSKIFYSGTYDPNSDEKAPDCYSDNGVGPSIRSARPQCGTCAACPQNVWGSKILPSGAQSKACADVKKVAVLLADNPEGEVFELRVPPASLKNWGAYISVLTSKGIPAGGIVTRLTFDTNSDFPKLVFSATNWASQEQVAAVKEVIGTDEVDVCTGKNDKPIDPAKALNPPKTITAPVAKAPPQPAANDFGNFPTPPAHTPEPTKRRGRPAKSVVPQQEAVMLEENFTSPNAAQVNVPISPPVTNAALDELINRAMNA